MLESAALVFLAVALNMRWCLTVGTALPGDGTDSATVHHECVGVIMVLCGGVERYRVQIGWKKHLKELRMEGI